MTTIKLLPILVTLGLSTLLGACGKQESPEVSDVARPVKSLLVAGAEQGGQRNFPARIDAVNKAELSFRIQGKVAELLVREGDRVEKDQPLAELDPTDFNIVLQDRQATFSRARADFDRAKGLIDKGFISRTDYDKLEAEFTNASAALSQAQQDVIYTKLNAPFKGTITKRHIERFEEVQAKQTVLSLRDNSQLRVQVDVPENILKMVAPNERSNTTRQKVPVWASFVSVPGKRFDLVFLEAAAQADPQTQTFEVTFTMPSPTELTVLPGMTANVTAELGKFMGRKDIHRVPVTAIGGDAKLDPRVWIVDENSMEVSERVVKIGKMAGSEIEVTEGLQAGDRVVTVGAAYLAEGMKVRLMAEPEQAEPRPDDLPLMIKP